MTPKFAYGFSRVSYWPQFWCVMILAQQLLSFVDTSNNVSIADRAIFVSIACGTSRCEYKM